MNLARLKFFFILSILAATGCGKVSKSTLKDGSKLNAPMINTDCVAGRLTDGPNGSKFAQICSGTS